MTTIRQNWIQKVYAGGIGFAAAGLALTMAVTPVSAQQLTKLRVSVIPITDCAPLFAAIRQGYFKDEGLEIDTSPSVGGARGLPALAAGAVQIAFSNIVSVALGVRQGLKFKIVAPGSVTAAAPPDMAGMLVKADTDIKSAQDLTGKKVAVNTRNNVIWLYARAWIDKEGGDSSKATYLEVPFPQMNDALAKGRVDAAFNVEPFVGAATAGGKMKVLGWPYYDVQKSVPVAFYVTTEKYLAANPEVIEKFARAYKKGVKWMNDNAGSEEWAAVIASYSRLKTQTIMNLKLPIYPEQADIAGIKTTVGLVRKYKLLDRDIDVDALVYKTAR